MKVKIERKAKWVFGWEMWGFMGQLQFDIGFWQWHVYFIFKEAKQ